jgi:hypothetical protein
VNRTIANVEGDSPLKLWRPLAKFEHYNVSYPRAKAVFQFFIYLEELKRAAKFKATAP